MKLYPGWSAKDNYTGLGKKKKRKKDKNADGMIQLICQLSLDFLLEIHVFFSESVDDQNSIFIL